jgi:hypothetical protein
MATQLVQIPYFLLLIFSRRNILSGISNGELRWLAVPQEKESLKVFLRVKPKTEHELVVYR